VLAISSSKSDVSSSTIGSSSTTTTTTTTISGCNINTTTNLTNVPAMQV
jgi:hypothetical protein